MLSRTGRLTLLAASSLTVMSSATIAPALPSMQRHFEGSDGAWVRLLLTLPGLAIALLAIPLGRVVDRLDRRQVLAAGAAVYALTGSAGLWLDDLTWLLVSRALLGASVAAVMTSATALIADYFDGMERGRFLGIQASFMSFGGVLFLLLGGWLAEQSWRGPYGVYLTAVPVMVLAWMLPKPRLATASVAASTEGDTPWLSVFGLGFAAFLAMIVFYTIPVQVPFDLERRLGLGGTAAGLAIAVGTLSGGLVSLVFGKLVVRFGSFFLLGATFFAMGLGLGGVGLVSSYAGVLVAIAVGGIGMGLMMPNLSQWTVRLAAPAHRATAIGVVVMGVFFGQFASPLVSHPLVAAIGGPSAFLMLGGLSSAVGIVVSLRGLLMEPVAQPSS
ncbi:MAG: MFS transporter [Myxococcales bacterium]|nr:MFS transporter [Myxococcales bacterium]